MRDLIGKIDTNLWSNVSAIVFLVAFLLLLAYVWGPKRAPRYQAAAKLPLEIE